MMAMILSSQLELAIATTLVSKAYFCFGLPVHRWPWYRNVILAVIMAYTASIAVTLWNYRARERRRATVELASQTLHQTDIATGKHVIGEHASGIQPVRK